MWSGVIIMLPNEMALLSIFPVLRFMPQRDDSLLVDIQAFVKAMQDAEKSEPKEEKMDES